MTDETLQALEWSRFLDLAAGEARTSPAKGLLLGLNEPQSWAADVPAARLAQQETQEMMPLLDREALWGPLSELPDPTSALDQLDRGAVLSVDELVLLRRWLYAVDSWVQIPREEIYGDRLKKSLSRLLDPYEPLRILDKVLTPEGELSMSASPRLSALHAEIQALRQNIGAVLEGLIRTFAQKGVLQENFTDVRDGRFVIPIKISHQNEVDGIVYEASASRQTVFVEPKEVSPLNNRLRSRQNDLMAEIYIVLEKTFRQLSPLAPEIRESTWILAHWDAVQAKARLARHYAGKIIQVTEDRAFSLQNVAHPLLWWSLPHASIIRNQIELGAPTSTLLITGPNTGGKTVFLKTLGLAGICARTGFPFPAVGVPQIPFFESFFSDLGDPQSIEQSLSSFSGHILRFKRILEDATPRSLILIDELNTATDPEEGAALGRALLETLMSRNAMIVATTHDPKLKILAGSDERILNASMAFDETARTPTFHMVFGVPGRSRALDTAKRLGISEDVLGLARQYLTREHVEFERMLEKLETDTHEAARLRKEAQVLKDEAERMRKEWTERTESSVNEMMERTRQKLRRILEQAQDEVRSSVRRLDEVKNRRDVDQARSSVNDAATQASRQIEKALQEEAPDIASALARKASEAPEAPAASPIAPGATVRVPKWKTTGTVLEVQGSKVRVAIGTMQITLPAAEVEPIAGEKPKKPQARIAGMDSGYVPPSDLDLRGTRFEEAMADLERYLDLAFRSGNLLEVTIIHGLGTGAIREGTRKLLSKLPYVKSYRDGGAGHGGAGATIVEFDRD